MKMDVRPLANEADHAWAVAQIAPYFEHEPAPGTPEAARFDVLSALIEHYEDRRCPFEAPDPVAMVRFAMEARGAGQADLAAVLGSRSRASEFLGGKRGLTVDQAFRLQEAWGLPVVALLRPSRRSAA
jgi:HTH-type transcriptional regulator/antitoxin HigA